MQVFLVDTKAVTWSGVQWCL